MPNITIKIGGPLRKKVRGLVGGERNITLPDGGRISDAVAALELIPTDVRVMMLNGRPVRSNVELAEGDRLAFFPPEQAFNMYVAINFFNTLLRDELEETSADND